MTTSPTRERWTLPPIQCQPWCTYQDGHPNDFCREDQRCYSEDLRIDLTLLPVLEQSYYVEGTGWVVGPDHIEVDAEQGGNERYPYIQIRKDSGPERCVAWKFTPLEARQLIDTVQLLLGQIAATR